MKKSILLFAALTLAFASAFAAEVKDTRGAAVVSDGRGESRVPATSLISAPTGKPVAVTFGDARRVPSVPAY